jgi:hypothetical protein
MIELHIISRNLTDYKKINIYQKFSNKDDLLNYLFNHNIIDSLDYILYYKNNKINDLPDLNDFSLIIKENTFYKSCSCCRKAHL